MPRRYIPRADGDELVGQTFDEAEIFRNRGNGRDYITNEGDTLATASPLARLDDVTAFSTAAVLRNMNAIYDTRAELEADLDHAVNATGLVTADPDPDNNAIYVKLGDTGEGSWDRTDVLTDAIGGIIDPIVEDVTTLSEQAGTARDEAIMARDAALGAAGGPAQVFQMTPSTLISGAVTRRMLQHSAPLSGMINSAGGNDAVLTRMLTSIGRFDQGPTGTASYFDTVLSIGHNVGDNVATGENPTEPVSRIAIESKFAQGQPNSPFISEWHLAALTPAGTTDECRALSVTIPHLASNFATVLDFSFYQRANVFVWASGAGQTKIQMDLRGASPVIDMGSVGIAHPIINFNTNNRAMFRQRNAAGTDYLDGLYFDSNDALTTGASATLQLEGVIQTASAIGAKALFVASGVSGMAANGYLAYLASANAVTGTVNGLYAEANASVKLENRTINVATAGKAGSQLRSSAGDIYREMYDATNGRYFTHIYYEATSEFRLGNAQQGGQFETLFAYSVDYAKFQMTFGYPIKLPSYAVSGLPSAATAGAGAQAYCTDETGGAVPVFSDGTNWRRVTDRVIAS